MKITPSIKGYVNGKYEITVDNRPGAIEISRVGNDLSLRIFAVSPTPYGMNHMAGFGGSSAKAYILEKSKFLYAQTQNSQWITLNLIELIWSFCHEYEVEINPIEFDLAGFVKSAIM